MYNYIKIKNIMKKISEQIRVQIEPLYLKLGSAEKVGKELNINPGTAVRYLKKLGYDFSSKTISQQISYSDALEQFKKWEGSLTTFCKKWKISMSHFLKYLKANNIKVLNKQNEVKFNENIFDVIDTEEKAYWLGFIYADGYISSLKANNYSKYQFEISLAGEDVDHLKKFNSFMEHIKDNVHVGSVKLNNKTFTRCRWTVRNRHLWETLNKLGCTPKKSLTLQFPNVSIFTSETLIKHFIRGYFDGDGCISYSNKEHTKVCLNVLGTKSMLEGINKYWPNSYSMRTEKNRNSQTYVISAAHTGAFTNLKYLYEGASIYLDRKYNRYLEFCRLYESKENIEQNR